MTERAVARTPSSQQLEPWQIYFQTMQYGQHRTDGKIELTEKNVEYIVFLAQQKKYE